MDDPWAPVEMAKQMFVPLDVVGSHQHILSLRHGGGDGLGGDRRAHTPLRYTHSLHLAQRICFHHPRHVTNVLR